MKLLSLLIFVTAATVTANSYSQQTKFNMNFENVTVRQIFQQIEENSEFILLYSEKSVDVDRKVNVNVTNQSVDKILDQVFRGTKNYYEIHDRQIAIMEKGSLEKPIIMSKTSETNQQKSISGKVTDSTGAALTGVTVVIKGTTSGTITDSNGNYSLANVPENATLQFSFVGMKKQELIVGNKTTINVTLEEVAIGIEEVVAVGYGTMKKTELTSAVSSVKASDFIKGANTDAAQLLKGKVAGLSIVQPDANPTGTSQIYLRGVTTLRSGSQPLVIVDGIPSSLSLVAPEDIESIDILKDGSASAIYGTRGTNGVILISTRNVKGTTPATIEVNSYMTVQTINKRLDFMNASEFRDKVIGGGYLPSTEDYGSDTDWLGEILRTPISQSHNVNLKGGNSTTNYIVNFNYKDTEGIIQRTNDNEYKTRIEVNHSMFDNKLRINASILSRQQKSFSGWNNKIYQAALIYNPTDRVKDDNGNWTEHTNVYLYDNPVSMLNEVQGNAKRTTLRTVGSVSYMPIDGLTFKLIGSNTTSDFLNGYSESKKNRSTIRDGKNGYASRNTDKNNDNLLQFTGEYVFSKKDHHVTALGGYSWENTKYESFFAKNWDFPSDSYSYNNLGAGQALSRGESTINSYQKMSSLISLFSRINYNYKGKYLFMASIRHEGSSKFGENNKWGNFPAASVGWNVKNENFMQDINVLSSLKIRAGWGTTGTAPDDSYVSISRLSTGSSYLNNGVWSPVIMPSSNANPDLKWEKKEETNIGLDFGLLKDRISLSIDAYKRKTIDLLWNYSVPKPPYLYDNVIANAGSMENKGIEVSLKSTIASTKDMNWGSSINFSANQNKVLSLQNDLFQLSTGYIETGSAGEPIQQATHRLEEGGKVGNFYGYKTIDIDDQGKWIIEGKDGTPKPIASQLPEDKKIIGNGIPKFFLSWDNQYTYKNFDLSITMNGAFGFDIINGAAMAYSCPIFLSRGNILNRAFDNVYGKMPLSANQDLQYVSYFVEKGDYWKISNVTLGYNLKHIGSGIKDMRIYLSGSNLFTFTKYSGIDPEVNILGLNPGMDDRQRYPSSRSFTVGLSITF